MICEIHNYTEEATEIVIGKYISMFCCKTHAEEYPRNWKRQPIAPNKKVG